MAYRSSQQSTINSSTTFTPTQPAGVVAGDQLIAFSTQDTSGCTYTGFSGWNKLDTTNITGPDGQTIAAFARIATGSDALALTSSAANQWSVTIVANSGRNATTTPNFQVTTPNTTSNASPVSLTLTGVTAATGDDILIFSALDITADTNSWVMSTASSTIRQNCLAANNWSQAATSTIDNVSAGATGNFSLTGTVTGGSAGWSGYVVNLPASAGGTDPMLVGAMCL